MITQGQHERTTGAFCDAGTITYAHRHIANQLLPYLNDNNRDLEYTISFISLISNSPADVIQTISTAERPGRCWQLISIHYEVWTLYR